jgi:quinol monooxygenase YgiN
MYGTIARLHPRPDKRGELDELGRSMVDGDPPPGFRSAFLFRPDRNPYYRDTVFLVAVFDDEASYRANADTPEQHARYLELRELLEDDPEWWDGRFVGG